MTFITNNYQFQAGAIKQAYGTVSLNALNTNNYCENLANYSPFASPVGQPDWLQQFDDELKKVAKHCQEWINNLAPQVQVNSLQALINFGDLLNNALPNLKNMASIKNASSQSNAIALLSAINEEAKSAQTTLANLTNQYRSFDAAINQDYTALKTTQVGALTQEKIESVEAEKFKNQINALKAALQKAAAGYGINILNPPSASSVGTIIFALTAATTSAGQPVTGEFSTLFGVAASVASGVLAEKSIQQQQDGIIALQKGLSPEKQLALALQGPIAMVSQLVEEANSFLSVDLPNASSFWGDTQSKIQQIINYFKAGQDQEGWQAVTELSSDNNITTWSDLTFYATQLARLASTPPQFVTHKTFPVGS